MRTRLFSPHRIVIAALALLLATPSNYALLNFEGTRNQVYAFGQVGLGYDSNLFARSGGDGDFYEEANAGLEFKRRAGLIAIDSRATLAYQRFDKFTTQSAWLPSFSLELNKTTGRTTGTLTVRAYRTSRADAAINVRTRSWNYPVGLTVKYPVNEKFYLTSLTTYLQRRFAGNSGLSNYEDYAEGVDAFRVVNSKLDLFGGYRYRYSTTDLGHATDHNFSLGATGGLLPKLNGLVRFGYQIRQDYGTRQTFGQISAAAELTWTLSRKLLVRGKLARDFTTTATSVSVDSLSATLQSEYAFTRRWQANGGIGGGRNRFLDSTQIGRRDEFFSGEAGVSCTLNDHLKVAASWNYLHNWSTFSLADFRRHLLSVQISGRY